MGLQTAPNVFYFPPSPTGSKVEPVKYDLSKKQVYKYPIRYNGLAVLSTVANKQIVVSQQKHSPISYLVKLVHRCR